MILPYYQTHWDSALVLFRQRSAWSSRPLGDATPLVRLEQRLRLHFHVLARSPETAEKQPETPPDAFVWLASQLSADDARVCQTGFREAYQLLGEGGAKALGAFIALSLSGSSEADPDALALYNAQPALRPILFRLWREQGTKVPRALYHQAELQSSHSDLQQAALHYAADQPQVSLELFRAYYQPLLGVARPTGIDSAVLVAALRGGLLRGDPDLPKVLRRAIELEPSSEMQLPLLRLAALSGDRECYPILRSRFASDPLNGAQLLALHGSLEAVGDLAAGLGQAQAMEPAARAWGWLTGQKLERKLRLSLVGGETTGGERETMPDAEAAEHWRNENRAALQDEGRFFNGQPLVVPTLFAAAQSMAGESDADLLDLLACQIKRPLGITANAWRSERQRLLSELANAILISDEQPSSAKREGEQRA